MMGRLFAAAVATAALLGVGRPAAAMPALYVAKHDRPMGHRAASVVVLRDGPRTVVTLQADYSGPPEDFVLVIPVPGEVDAEQVRVLDRRLLDRLDGVTAPRLVERWEVDPCLARAQPGPPAPAEPPPIGVQSSPTFQDGEYSVMAPGIAECASIVEFLRARDYYLGAEAEAALRPHADAGMRFLIAEVDRDQVHFNRQGEALLSPLRYQFDSERLTLPLKLGASQALGAQDLVIHVLALGRRFEAANLPAAQMPTAIALRGEARERIGPVHAALFDATLAHQPGAVITEYAARADECDPCIGGPLTREELQALGADAAPGLASGEIAGALTITRLHARFAPGTITADLELRGARPIVGGTDEHPEPGPAPVADPALDGRDDFQTRYLIRHAWAGSLACADPLHGVWGPSPTGAAAEPRFVRALSDVDRTLALPEYLAQDLPALGITAKRCGCDAGGAAGLVWLVVLGLLRRRRG